MILALYDHFLVSSCATVSIACLETKLEVDKPGTKCALFIWIAGDCGPFSEYRVRTSISLYAFLLC